MERKLRIIANIFLAIALCAVCIVIATACRHDGVASVSVVGKEDILVGNFDYSDYTVEVLYESGKTERVALDKSMLSAEDNLKFFEPGEQTFTVNYKDKTCEFKVKVCRYEFSDLVFNDVRTVYDGKAVTAEVLRNYPEGTEVYYPTGNSFVNAGEYEVKAIVSRRNYVTVTLTAKVVIEKATYDMSGVALKDATFDYDGKSHSLEVTGSVPEGVTVSYENNTFTDAGVYDVTAKFLSDNSKNYNEIANLSAKLTINKAKYDVSELTFKGDSVTFDNQEHTLSAENLPSGVTVEYSVQKIISEEKYSDVQGVKVKDAGKYLYTATFFSDNKNYETIEKMTAKLTINQAEFNVVGIEFKDIEATYDGQGHKPSTYLIKDETKSLPDGVIIKQTWFTQNGKALHVDGDETKEYLEEVTDAGTYTYNVTLECEDANYTVSEALVTTFVIEKAVCDVSKIVVSDCKYTGTEVTPEIEGIPAGLEYTLTFYTKNPNDGKEEPIKGDDEKLATGVVEEGEYYVLITFIVQDEKNYEVLSTSAVEKFTVKAAEQPANDTEKSV